MNKKVDSKAGERYSRTFDRSPNHPIRCGDVVAYKIGSKSEVIIELVQRKDGFLKTCQHGERVGQRKECGALQNVNEVKINILREKNEWTCLVTSSCNLRTSQCPHNFIIAGSLLNAIYLQDRRADVRVKHKFCTSCIARNGCESIREIRRGHDETTKASHGWCTSNRASASYPRDVTPVC